MKKLLVLFFILTITGSYPIYARNIVHDKSSHSRKDMEKQQKMSAAAKINKKESTLKSNFYLHNDPRGTTPSETRTNLHKK